MGSKKTVLDTQISIAVKALRIEQGLTQTQLSNKARISQGALSKIERGNMKMSYAEAVRIMKALGCVMICELPNGMEIEL